jgi:hypothetical protein
MAAYYSEREGVVSAGQARAILARYAEPAARGLPWGGIIFSCLGAWWSGSA